MADTPANDALAELVAELTGRTGPEQTINLLVGLLNGIRTSAVFPDGLPLGVNGETAVEEELLLMEIALTLTRRSAKWVP